MSIVELEGLADDIRQAIVSTCMKNGGHLGASLGAVELAIALHFVFDSPSEPIVWDVGHQAYAHKLLTGRWKSFSTLRLDKGLSGFLSREESPHDVFGAGHSSTALSAALAMAHSRSQTAAWTVAVVGDGGLTAGLAYEALNNAKAAAKGPLLLILNDNQMSISQNVGALPGIFSGGEVKRFFELFGFDYIGPGNGHDLHELVSTLHTLRNNRPEKPIIFHVHTQKGKGYVPAEENPATYHGISPVQEKVPGKPTQPKQQTYSDVFGEELCRLASEDERVVAITAAMPEGTGLSEFARRFPDRFFDVGIAEQHAVTFAAGLATQGLKPVVAIYSTFLQRALDQIIHDVALQNLGVTFAVDRAGLVGADGPTHHGMFDLAFLGMVPNLTLSAPASSEDLRQELRAALASGKPWAIRYPRGSAPGTATATHANQTSWQQKPLAPRLIVLSLGATQARAQVAVHAADPGGALIASATVVRAKPLDSELLSFLNAHPDTPVVTIEDGVIRGGFGQALASSLAPRKGAVQVLGYPDQFVAQGSIGKLEEQLGLSSAALTQRFQSFMDGSDHEKAH